MDFIERLEFNKLIKELDYVDSELTYKSHILKIEDEKFIKNVNDVLETFPQLRNIIDEKNKQRFDNISNMKQNLGDDNISVFDGGVILEKNQRIKTLYRQISKSTHPDVTSQSNLQELYLEAQKAYDSNNLLQILSICDKLKINYEITFEEFDLLKEEIYTKRKRIEFLESTYTWKWFHMPTEDEKNQIILNYLQTQIAK